MPTKDAFARPLSPGFPARVLAAWFGVGLLAVAACGHDLALTGAAKGAAGSAGATGLTGATGSARATGLTGATGGKAEKLAPFNLSNEALCAVPAARRSAALPSAAPFSSPETSCVGGPDPFCDTVDRSPVPGDLCFVANDNIARAEREVARGGGRGRAAPRDPWDGASKPRFLDRVDAHLHLLPEEHARLRTNGFVVLDRLAYDNYANAFHDIFQEQLPLYVGVDPVLHAVFRGTELVLERVEKKRMFRALDAVLVKLRAGLAASRGRYDAETLADLDLYLGVAAMLAWGTPGEAGGGALVLRYRWDDPVASRASIDFAGPSVWPDGRGVSLFGQGSAVAELAQRAAGGGGLEQIELFGRPRMVDFSQLTPRGHYATRGPHDYGDHLGRYFRAMMWLSRLEFNLASRSCKSSHPGAEPDPSETPREARDALALAEIAGRSGALAEIAAFEEVYGAFAGRREDVSVPDLLRLMREGRFSARDAGAPERLREAVGGDFRRTARVHYMPQGAAELPAIATLFGPRVVPDVAPLTRLVHDELPGRTALGAADVAFVLGHDGAKRLLGPSLAAHPGLEGALQAARGELRAGVEGRGDVYAGWLRSLLALADPPSGVAPSFMRREAYADLRMNSALVGYGQLRHTFMLLAGQGYDSYGCEIPDAYVEPLPEVYDALLAHVRRMRAQAGGFGRLEGVLKALRAIVATEASGAPIGEAERRWLGMVSEHRPLGGLEAADSGEPPKWTGWYFDMFEDREIGATNSAAFVADYFTLTNENKVEYLGAEGPRLGVFVVDVNGEPRAMVGPVAKGYEADTPLDAGRLDDEKAVKHTPKRAPWREGYAAPPVPEPALGLVGRTARCPGGGAGLEWRVVLRAERALGPVTVTLLDHHADPLVAPLTLEVGPGLTAFAFDLPRPLGEARFGVEAVHVHVDRLERSGAGSGPYDYFTSPSVFRESGLATTGDERGLRPQGAVGFVLDGDEGTPTATSQAPAFGVAPLPAVAPVPLLRAPLAVRHGRWGRVLMAPFGGPLP